MMKIKTAKEILLLRIMYFSPSAAWLNIALSRAFLEISKQNLKVQMLNG